MSLSPALVCLLGVFVMLASSWVALERRVWWPYWIPLAFGGLACIALATIDGHGVDPVAAMLLSVKSAAIGRTSQWLGWVAFFAAYGSTFTYLWRRAAVIRLRILTDASPTTRVPLGMALLCCAIAPPLAEIVVRILVRDAVTQSDFGLIAFSALWIAALVPGFVSHHRILRAAGIDPNADA